jgi:ATP dependent DNA ligase domain
MKLSQKTVADFLVLEPQKYWSLPARASTTQKQKLAAAVDGNAYLASLKVDGALYTLIKTPDKVMLNSRTKSVKDGNFVNKIDNVPHIAEWASDNLPDNTVLVGEICLQDIKASKSNKITEVMGCKPAKAIERQAAGSKLAYYVFDILMWGGTDLTELTNAARVAELEKVKALNHPEFILVANYLGGGNYTQAAAEILESGYEGLVLLRKTAKWKTGRTAAWDSIKIKQELMQTVDCVVIGTKPSDPKTTTQFPQSWKYWRNVKTGELVYGSFYDVDGYEMVNKNFFEGLPSAVEIGVFKGGELVSLGYISNLTDEQRRKKEALVGAVVEVSAMSFDPVSCRFRHAKILNFRTDKEAAECTWEQIMN